MRIGCWHSSLFANLDQNNVLSFRLVRLAKFSLESWFQCCVFIVTFAASFCAAVNARVFVLQHDAPGMPHFLAQSLISCALKDMIFEKGAECENCFLLFYFGSKPPSGGLLVYVHLNIQWVKSKCDKLLSFYISWLPVSLLPKLRLGELWMPIMTYACASLPHSCYPRLYQGQGLWLAWTLTHDSRPLHPAFNGGNFECSYLIKCCVRDEQTRSALQTLAGSLAQIWNHKI